MMREWMDLRWFGEWNGEDLRSLEREYSGKSEEAIALWISDKGRVWIRDECKRDKAE